MSRDHEETKAQLVWESLKTAGLVEIRLDEFPERIKEVKRATLGRLGELLELNNGLREQESVAHSLGFLKKMETTVREDVGLPKPERSGPSEG